MTPREIDSLIATKVMGWKILTCKGIKIIAPPDYDGPDMMINADIKVIPSYSTDISAAWQVVEKMQEYGYILMLDATTTSEYYISFVGLKDGSHISFFGNANTAPMAICRAALKCVGVEVGDE